jgi:hypothetical protein
LFARDASLWSNDMKVQQTIADRLGWIDAPTVFAERTAGLEGFGDGIIEDGFTTAVLAGMGGSSLAPDILHRTFGSQDGYLDMRILDSTDPAYVAATVDDLDPLRTLVVVASKSGTTTEAQAFFADAWARAQVALDTVGHHAYERPDRFIVVITDPGPSVEAFPHHDDLREIFLNPPDIGGRYSALTYVGLVPASLIGLDLDALLASAATMAGACRQPDPETNPGVSLGLAIGTLATLGHDKLTFLIDDDIKAFGSWVEQLLAESTGKRGVGIVPIDLEPLGAVDSYGPGIRPDLARRIQRWRTQRACGRARGGRSSGHPHHAQRSHRRGGRGMALGGRHLDRRHRDGHRPVRPAQRGGGQGAHPQAPRRGRARASRRLDRGCPG